MIPQESGGFAVRFPSTILRGSDGQWTLRHEIREIGRVEVTAPTREQPVEKLRGEISYRLELCACSDDTYQNIKIEIVN